MTGYIAFSHTELTGFKVGDHIVAAHMVRLFIENHPHDHWILTLNPASKLNFVFDQVVLEYNVEVLYDVWPDGDIEHLNRCLDERRRTRMVQGRVFDTYKEIYCRTHGGPKQRSLCGRENGLGHRNIFDYYFFGQEGLSPQACMGGGTFGRYSLGYQWKPTTPKRSVFVAPIAFSQTNEVFTMDFWKQVIDALLDADVDVTVNTPNQGQFGSHQNLCYFYSPGSVRGMFEEVQKQRLVLCGNTGVGWVAGAYGVPLIAGQPKFFWFQDYRYDWCGVQSLVNIFGQQSGADAAGNNFEAPDPQEPVRMVLEYLEKK